MNQKADPRSRQVRACLSKLRFSKRREAESAAAINSKRYGVNMSYYECDFCSQYHLFTKDKHGKPRIDFEDSV